MYSAKAAKTSYDGTVLTTVGKRLSKSITLKAKEIEGIYSLGGQYKEITFAIMPAPLYFYIDKKDDDHKLLIEDKSSIEALISTAFIEVPPGVDQESEFQIWLWS